MSSSAPPSLPPSPSAKSGSAPALAPPSPPPPPSPQICHVSVETSFTKMILVMKEMEGREAERAENERVLTERLQEARIAETAARTAADEVAKAVDAIGERLAGELQLRKQIALMKREAEDLADQVAALRQEITALKAAHAAELEDLRASHARSAREASERASDALTSMRERMVRERESMLSERESAWQRSREHVQEVGRAQEAAWVRLKADYEARIIGLEGQLATQKKAANMQEASASNLDCLRSQMREMKAMYEAKLAAAAAAIERSGNTGPGDDSFVEEARQRCGNCNKITFI